MRKTIQTLKNMGILGLNQRNADYIALYNPRRLYPLVDDKLRTKKLALQAGIAVPKLYGAIEIPAQVKNLAHLTEKHADFVVKPAHGSGGEGIIVISGRAKDAYRKINGTIVQPGELAYHVENTLSGMYSLGGHPDMALIEYRVRFDSTFEHISYLGVPDIRIIVFLGVPVMSMIRLPTRLSDGKANLHQGAIGAGISIATGRTTHAVWKNHIVGEHPDTGHSVHDITIPRWPELLRLASRCHDLTGLGYQGVDIVLDKNLGPLLLELNARPGLNIQIANRAGLLPRLKLVEQHHKDLNTLEKKIAFAQENFRGFEITANFSGETNAPFQAQV